MAYLSVVVLGYMSEMLRAVCNNGHMALVMQGLTSTDKNEKLEILDMIAKTDADTGYLHEGFHVDDPYVFTREWFTWPNSLFAEFVEQCVEQNLFEK